MEGSYHAPSTETHGGQPAKISDRVMFVDRPRGIPDSVFHDGIAERATTDMLVGICAGLVGSYSDLSALPRQDYADPPFRMASVAALVNERND